MCVRENPSGEMRNLVITRKRQALRVAMTGYVKHEVGVSATVVVRSLWHMPGHGGCGISKRVRAAIPIQH